MNLSPENSGDKNIRRTLKFGSTVEIFSKVPLKNTLKFRKIITSPIVFLLRLRRRIKNGSFDIGSDAAHWVNTLCCLSLHVFSPSGDMFFAMLNNSSCLCPQTYTFCLRTKTRLCPYRPKSMSCYIQIVLKMCAESSLARRRVRTPAG